MDVRDTNLKSKDRNEYTSSSMLNLFLTPTVDRDFIEYIKKNKIAKKHTG
ncbi:MAG: hypothetical protein J7M25_12040 [Deltaproteobacteria bacterium]|nr:hypothetical protein [Deltaproteobacteria bacterium]